TAADRDELANQLARFARSADVQALLVDRLTDTKAPRDVRKVVLQAMARSGLKEAPDGWATALAAVLSGADAEVAREAVSTVRALPVSKARSADVAAALRTIASEESTPAHVRLTALASVPGGLTAVDPKLFDYLRSRLSIEEPVATRGVAAD